MSQVDVELVYTKPEAPWWVEGNEEVIEETWWVEVEVL